MLPRKLRMKQLCSRRRRETYNKREGFTASATAAVAVILCLADKSHVLQGSRLVVTNARNVNQERGTKQSLRSEKQSSKQLSYLNMD